MTDQIVVPIRYCRNVDESICVPMFGYCVDMLDDVLSSGVY